MSLIVAVLSSIPQLSHHLRLLLPKVTFLELTQDKEDIGSVISKIEILIADMNLLVPHINNVASLKWVQSTWAGLDKFVSETKKTNYSFTITRFSGISFGNAMSEYVVSQIVNFERDQRKQYENQKNSLWNIDGKISNHRRLCDLTVGILGIGEIGNIVAKALKMFGATVWGMSRTMPVHTKYIDKHFTTKNLSEILKNCDYIINTMPSTEATMGLLNGKILKDCSDKKSVFINIGRGSIIREADLINALEENWISGAILDVFEDEPLAKDSRLWTLPQVTISPHVSGISQPKDIASAFAENYENYLKEKPLKNIFDINRGY